MSENLDKYFERRRNDFNNYYGVVSTIYQNDYDLIENEVKALDRRLKTRSMNTTSVGFHSKIRSEKNDYYKAHLVSRSKNSHFNSTRPGTQSSCFQPTPWRKHNLKVSEKKHNSSDTKKVFYKTIREFKKDKSLLSKSTSLYYKTIDSKHLESRIHSKAIAKRNACFAKRYIRSKLAKFERTISVVNDETDTNECIKNAKREFTLENYRQERISRTNQILSEIDATDPYLLDRLYKYKLTSMLSFQEESQTVKDRLYKMLRDPKRLVARIEKHKVCKLKLAYSRNKAKAS